MALCISLFLLLFNLGPTVSWSEEFAGFFREEGEEYWPLYRSFSRHHQPVDLQTLDRSIINPFLPKSVRKVFIVFASAKVNLDLLTALSGLK